jgi:hypothetical protein
MSLELSCDSLAVSGTARRQIPVLYRYSSASISVPQNQATRITTDTVLNSQSVGSSGFVYQVPGHLRNTSGRKLLVRVSYSIVWVSVTATRTAWIQLDDTADRYGMSVTHQHNFDPCQSGTAILSVPNDSKITVWAYQGGSGFTLPIVAKWGSPSIQITII